MTGIKRIILPLLCITFCFIFSFTSHAQQPFLSYRGNFGEMIYGLGYIHDAAFSPEGNYLAASGSHGVFIWDLHSDLQHPIHFHPFFYLQETSTSLRYRFISPNGVKFVDEITFQTQWSGEWFTRDIRDGIPFDPLIPFEPVPSLSIDLDVSSGFSTKFKDVGITYSHDGNLYLNLQANSLTLHDAATGALIFDFNNAHIADAEFNSDDNRIITADRSKTITIWDTAAFKPVNSFAADSGAVDTGYDTIRISPADPIFVVYSAGGVSNIVELWNYETGTLQSSLPGYTNGRIMSISPNGGQAYRSFQDINQLISIPSGEVLHNFPKSTIPIPDGEPGPYTYSPRVTAYSANGTLVAAVWEYSETVRINIWESESGKLLSSVIIDADDSIYPEYKLQFSQDQTKLALVQNKRIDVVDIQSGALLQHAAFSPEQEISKILLTTDLTRLVYISRNGFPLHVVDMALDEVIQEIFLEDGRRGELLAVTPNDQAIVSSHRNIYVIDLNQGEIVSAVVEISVILHNEEVIFSEDGQYLLTVGGRAPDLFTFPSFQHIDRITNPSISSYRSAALIADEEKILFGNSDGTVVEVNIPFLSHVPSWTLYQ
jgi:WD40 repeat protein